jgi:hypothetical protein
MRVTVPDEVFARLRRLAMPPAEYWAHRAKLPWS